MITRVRLRPGTPVFAATPNVEIAGASTLLWGIVPVVTNAREIMELQHLLVAGGLVPNGAVVVYANVSADLDRTDANFINVQRFA